jgi:tetratricopeptide (TPR) repeat protein
MSLSSSNRQPTVHTEEKEHLTEEKIQEFYQVVVNATRHELGEVARAAKHLEKHYVLYLQHVFGMISPLNPLLVTAKKKDLTREIGMLVHHGVLDAILAKNIEANNFSVEALEASVEEDERQDLLDRMKDMVLAANYSATSSAAPQVVLAKNIKSGLSAQDMRPQVTGEASSGSISTSELFMRQIADLMIAERFPEGIAQLQEMIAAKDVVSDDVSEDQKHAVINYKRMLARAYQEYGAYFQFHAKKEVLPKSHENYEKAIQYFTMAVDLAKEIHAKGLADTTNERRIYQKTLANGYDVYACAHRKQQDFQGEIKNISAAIKVIQEISFPVSNTNKINLCHFRRNLVAAKFMAAVSEMESLKNNADKKLNPTRTCEEAAKKINFCIRTSSLLLKKSADLIIRIDSYSDDSASVLPLPGSPILGSVPSPDSQASVASVSTVTNASAAFSEEHPALTKLKTEILTYQLFLADINKNLTTFWCEKRDVISAMSTCKSIIDALMPGHSAGKLAPGYEALLVESNVMLKNLVLDYQFQNNLPRDEQMKSGYAAAKEILVQHNNNLKTKAWAAITPGVLNYLSNKEVSLFGRTLLLTKQHPAKEPLLVGIESHSFSSQEQQAPSADGSSVSPLSPRKK